MSTLAEIEQAIVRLPPEDYQRLREWLDEREAQDVDRQLESAIAAGQFDVMASQALADDKAGRTTPF